SDDEDVGGHEEGNKSDESDDDRDEGSDVDSEETVKAGAGLVRRQEYNKKKTQTNCIVTSISIREGAYK
nr:hypothetical protein [Tanacetum cinerariifolium]